MYFSILCALAGALRYIKGVYRAAGPDAAPFLEAAERLEAIIDRGFLMPTLERDRSLEWQLAENQDVEGEIGYHDLPSRLDLRFPLQVIDAIMGRQRPEDIYLEALEWIVDKSLLVCKWGDRTEMITPVAKQRIEDRLGELHGKWEISLEDQLSFYHEESGTCLFLACEDEALGLTWKGEGDEQVLDVRGGE